MTLPWRALQHHLGSLDTGSVRPVAGGDINESFVVSGEAGRYFVKWNRQAALLSAEADNLGYLAGGPVRIPGVIYSGSLHGWGVLVMEYLDLRAAGDEAALGTQLASLHRQTDKHFGLDGDNFIGATEQINRRCDDWADFWWQCRLQPQLRRAAERGFRFDHRALQLAVMRHLGDHHPPPSLLHGDLWGGNKAFLADGTPVLFDPACYYGDRETDIAFTHLFGGFGDDFHRAYQAAWPLPEGADRRREVYNLYHLLNHLNLFGTGYLSACRRQIAQVCESVSD